MASYRSPSRDEEMEEMGRIINMAKDKPLICGDYGKGQWMNRQ